jgi:hypothetical protein
MFEGATVEDGILITDLSKLGYSYSYYATKSIGTEDFFTNLFNIWRITDATNMFKGLRITNTQYNTIDGRFPIREVSNNFLDSNCGGASLTSCSGMFMGTRCFGDIKITKDVFVGGQMTSGFSADHMFYDAIPTNPQKTSGHYVHIGSHAFHYCNNASDMFSGNTGLREVRLIGRETLCNEKTKTFFGQYPNGDRMFDGCSNLTVFYTTTSNNSNLEMGYHKISSGENCFSGCKLDNLGSLECAYHFLSECAVSTIGISKEWAQSSYGVSAMSNLFNVSYPTLSVNLNGGRIIHFEYN